MAPRLHAFRLLKRLFDHRYLRLACPQKVGGQAAISKVELAGAGGQNFQEMSNVRSL